MIDHIPELYAAGINSFKIEGRAKSAYYTAVAVNAYRSALDGFAASGFSPDYKIEDWMRQEVYKASNRQYCTGFFFSSPMDDAQIYYEGGYVRQWDVAAVAHEWKDGVLYATQRNRFFEGDELEAMVRGGAPVAIKVTGLKNGEGESVTNAPHPMMELSFDCPVPVPPGSYLRKKRD